ncbi:MAG: hypothetical protein Q8L10_01870 [Candidatus Moranbacteria bacterium]|nr:hypothetical protein [Candidatus Moranbacteria bacterium]
MKKKANKIGYDQQTAVLDDINSKFDLILEQFSGLNRKIDNNHQEFLEFKGEMVEFRDQTGKNFKELFEFRDQTGKNFDIVKEYLFRIDEEIQNLKGELEDLKKTLKEKADLDKLAVLEKRLVKLEKLVFARLA